MKDVIALQQPNQQVQIDILSLSITFNPEAQILRVDQDVMVFHPTTGKYFKISESAEKLLLMLKGVQKTGYELITELTSMYATSEESTKQMVTIFLSQMIGAGVVRTDDIPIIAPVSQKQTLKQKMEKMIFKIPILSSLERKMEKFKLPIPNLSERDWKMTLTLLSILMIFWVIRVINNYSMNLVGHKFQYHWLWIMVPWLVLHFIIHEFSHAYTVKHVGGKIREMGIGLLYYFIPVAYVSYTDAYRLPKKKRAVVSIIGPIADLFMMTITATVVVFNQGEFGLIAYRVLIYEFGTFLFNINPLLPSDLFRALENWFGPVNIRKKSFEYLKCLVFRRELPQYLQFLSRGTKAFYLFYSSISLLYIVMIFSAMLYIVLHIFE